MAYCAGSLSLAALEYFVHVETVDLPGDLVVIQAHLPDDAVLKLEISSLPKDWRDLPGPLSLQRIGDEWVQARRSVALAVPSAIIPSERNVLLNPAHPDMKRLRREEPEPFAFDRRMKR